jgi:alkylation response protein AidB-like acyl-CoA dehydrogenase
MDFGLSEEQQMLQQTVRGFVANECPATRLRQLFDGDTGHAPDLWKGLAEMGIAGLAIPEAYGGAGLELLDLALAAETLGEGATPGPFFGHSVASLAIARAGNEAQRERWLPRLANGDAIATIALAETDSAWQPDEWSCVLQDGKLTGDKGYAPCLELADVVVVGIEGGGLALVEPGAAGVAAEPFEGVDRTRRLHSLRFEGAPAEALAEGVAAAGAVRDAALVLLAADAFGAAWKLIRMTIDYCGTREQFETPLTQFQAVKHELADCALEIEPTRALYWYAAHAIDHLPDEASYAAALAKAHITDRAMEIARSCVELHGGIGFTWDCDVHIWFKRIMFDRTFLGTPEVHRARSADLAGW